MVHAFVARLPQTSQSCSEAAEDGEGSAGSVDAAEEEAGADADAPDEVPPSTPPTNPREDATADAVGEVVVGEVDNDGDVSEVDGPVAALVCFPPFFFVMGWCVGVLEA